MFLKNILLLLNTLSLCSHQCLQMPSTSFMSLFSFSHTYIYSKIPNFVLSYNHTKCYNLTVITMLKDIIYIYFNSIKNKSWRQYNIANLRGARLTAKLSLLSKVIPFPYYLKYTYTDTCTNMYKHIYIWHFVILCE